jgi:hypothetical protein
MAKEVKIGDKCFLTENARVSFGFEDGIVFKVKDILLGVEYPITISTEKFGKDWVQFVREDEIIIIEE